jgi:energy-coupling factor transporter transmembrane protein EcfT
VLYLFSSQQIRFFHSFLFFLQVVVAFVTIVYVSNRYSLQGDAGAGPVNPFSAGNSVRDNQSNFYILTVFVILAAATSASTASAVAIAFTLTLITTLQKLVEIVRACDKKQRRRRVGSSDQAVAVEMTNMQGVGQAHAAHDL